MCHSFFHLTRRMSARHRVHLEIHSWQVKMPIGFLSTKSVRPLPENKTLLARQILPSPRHPSLSLFEASASPRNASIFIGLYRQTSQTREFQVWLRQGAGRFQHNALRHLDTPSLLRNNPKAVAAAEILILAREVSIPGRRPR